MTRFLADENIPLESIRRLRLAGYDVRAVIEESPGAKDRELLIRAAEESRIVLTFDRDYGELVYRQRVAIPAGIVFFRFAPAYPAEPADYLLGMLSRQTISLEGRFTVIERGWIRQRPLPEFHSPIVQR
ncbi:MAG: hypothetical protein D6793_10600 [Thermoflexia bacterium]|nr:MAG: hypothetical protein D6793_10600 [Thermoflexia bacterium]